MLTLRRLSAAFALLGAAALALLLAAGSPAAATAPHADLATVAARPGQALRVSGTVRDAVAVKLQLVTPDGKLRGPYGPFTVTGGRVSATLPAAATAGLEPTKATGYRLQLGVQALPATATAARELDGPPAGIVRLEAAPSGPVLENSFVSSVGWVKPGERYPFTLRVRNYGAEPVDGGTVTVPEPAGTSFTRRARELGRRQRPGRRRRRHARRADARRRGARRRRSAQDPQVVWKDLSTTATLTYTARPAPRSASHGPKVIPPSGDLRHRALRRPAVPDGARRLLRPQRTTRPHGADALAGKINDPADPGSTFNLYQEMSYGQLFPHGDGALGGHRQRRLELRARASTSRKTRPRPAPAAAPTIGDLAGDDLPARYPRADPGRLVPAARRHRVLRRRLPARRSSARSPASARCRTSTRACGPTGKAVYDAAQIADPEIDYNDYDTDKDGVVDFFMMVFAGLGGNGDSQLNGVPPYDNIWPHSSSLRVLVHRPGDRPEGLHLRRPAEATSRAARSAGHDEHATARLTTDGHGRRPARSTCASALQRQPRVGHRQASVISHEYGHSPRPARLLLDGQPRDLRRLEPDGRGLLPAHGRLRQAGARLGRPARPPARADTRRRRTGSDIKNDTHGSTGSTPDGDALHAARGDRTSTTARPTSLKLPGAPDHRPGQGARRRTHVWWSRPGNDFGCPPTGGHNLDIALPGAGDVPGRHAGDADASSRAGTSSGTSTTASCSVTTDGGETYTSLAVGEGLHDPPGAEPEQQRLPGASTATASPARAARTRPARRRSTASPATYRERGLRRRLATTSSASPARASSCASRYSTDPGLDRPGWFIDDVKVTAGDQVDLLERLRADRATTPHLQRRLRDDGPADRAALHRRAGVTSRRRRRPRRPRLLPGAARPLGLRLRRPRRGRPRHGSTFAPGPAARLHRREPRLRQHRHRRPAGPVAAGLAARAWATPRRTSTTPRSRRCRHATFSDARRPARRQLHRPSRDGGWRFASAAWASRSIA